MDVSIMKKYIRAYLDHTPTVDASCYVDELSVVIGDVHLAANVSVWPFAVIRGDVNHPFQPARCVFEEYRLYVVAPAIAPGL